ncbi:alpha/beta hydrolase [Leifsonia bigeumensis]|uniref:Alpha/beta hydrolase n=1 Tax=Leifsonella bigeumensis TaxID=433643 RepID=A0ABP7F3G6_9MICO
METTTFALGSGRVVGVTEFGNPEAEQVVVLAHPAPGSSLFDPDPVATSGRIVRVIAVDRPGYGLSEPLPEGEPFTIAQAADDVAEVLRSRGVERFGAAGWSAGGRIALALAAMHPGLVDRVAIAGTPAPDGEVPWIPDDLRGGLEALATMAPADALMALTGQFDALVGAKPTGRDLVGFLIPPGADEAMLPAAEDRLVVMLDNAVRQSNAGMAADILSYTVLDQGFDLAEVQAKALLIYGAKDAIGGRHATWYQRALPDARVEMDPNAGHLVVVPHWDRMLSHLAPGSKPRGSKPHRCVY